MYVTFADISLSPNGFRRLILNGFRFGERGSSSGVQIWQCTANTRDPVTGKSRRCPARVKTKIIGWNSSTSLKMQNHNLFLTFRFNFILIADGYEMVKDTDVTHIHPRPEYNWFSKPCARWSLSAKCFSWMNTLCCETFIIYKKQMNKNPNVIKRTGNSYCKPLETNQNVNVFLSQLIFFIA